MNVHFSLDAVPRMPGATLTMGTFDGVHLGHQAVIGETIRQAAGGPSVVLTYFPHPREVVRGEGPPLLTLLDEKVAVLGLHAVDHLVVLPFTKELAAWPAERFVDDVLATRLGVKAVVVGHDHRFGLRGAGDAALLREMGAARGFAVTEVPPLVVDGQTVSSSAIRARLDGGAAAGAAALLGRRYTLAGTVVEGDRRGRTLGYPTANIRPDAGKLVPGHGIYAVRVRIERPPHVGLEGVDGGWRDGLASLGTRPTFDGQDVRLEVYLFDFDGDLYGQRLRVAFVEKLRSEQRFASAEALVAQMDEDAVIGRRVLASVS